MPLSTGTRLGPYEIVGPLGAGGMGEVYKARDTRLNRFVAIKVLSADRMADEGRKQRFIWEAQTASALNHPNIISIYDIAIDNGRDYMVMEYVTGKTLDTLIPRTGMRPGELLKIAVQVAEGLSAAHAAGIVHRDLKPSNVMVSENGLVKILDFGLAKLTERGEISEDEVTRTLRPKTDACTIVGTVAYMSPEQAEGRKVDARSDIFSFGLLLYEMLSGKRAFRAETRMATLAAILNQEPAPLGEIVPELSKELERIVTRCLRKDLARRAQHMADVNLALEELKEETESGVSASVIPAGRKPTSRWRWMSIGGAALAVCAALLFLLPYWRETQAPLKEVPLTSYPGSQGYPALSPDGSQFAFVWDGGQENAPPQVYVSLAGQGRPLRLTNTPTAARYTAWSPDGQTIAFLRPTAGSNKGDLILIPALGGPERRIDKVVGRPTWSPDGKWFYFSGVVSPTSYALFVQPSGGGDKRRLTDPPAEAYGDRTPAVSPDGRQLVFIRAFADYDEDLFVADLRDGNRTGTPRRLTSDHRYKYSPVWTTEGKDIIYIAGQSTSFMAMYRVRVSGGPPVRMAGIGDYAQQLAIAPKGNKLVYSRSFRDYNIWRMPLGGNSAGAPSKFIFSTRYEVSPAYSPDGKHIAFSSNRSGARQIWVADAEGSNPVALTSFTEGVAGSPKWSPDSQTVVFDARPEGPANVYSVPADGGTAKRLTDHPVDGHVPCYSADGRWIYFASTRSGQRQIYRMPSNGGEAVQITRKGALVPSSSPDGRWIYYSKPDEGIWKVPVDGGGEETQVLDERSTSGNPFAFCVTASGIYFAGAPDPTSRTVPLKLYRFADGRTVELGRFDKALQLHISVSPDEKWLLYTQLDSSLDDLMLVENFR